jgi:serine/threonine protein kinase
VVHLINTAGFGPQIGAGAFSTVHRTTVLINDVHTECAIKTFKSNYQYVGRAEAETQVGILNALNGYSDYIVKYYGHVSTARAGGKLVPVPLEAEGSTISIAMELVNGPTVDNLEAGFSSLTTEERLMLSKKIVRDVLRGAAALSQKGFAHNDFKPNNLIWSEDENRVKLLDISNAGKFLDEKPMGHPFYTGPERIGRMPAEGLSTKAPTVAKTRLPEPFQQTAAESLQVFLDEFKEHYLPLHPTSDSYGIGQILHKLVQGTFFLPVDPKILQRHASDNFTDFKPLQLATIIGWAGKSKPAIVFDDTKKREDPDYILKDRHGFFDAVNNLMAVDYRTRVRPEDALKLPFFTENFPDEETCNALYEKCKNAAATLHEQNAQDALERQSASIYPPSQGPWAPAREVLANPGIATASISTAEVSGRSSDLFQKPNPGKKGS